MHSGVAAKINMFVVTVALWTYLLLAVSGQDDQQCTVPSGSKSCVCDTGSGIIDLTSMHYDDGNAFFTEYDTGGNQFFYNPCEELREGFADCSYGGVSVCQDYGGGDANCGTTASEKIVLRDDGNYYVLYDGGTDGRSSEVRLICDQSYDTPLFQPYGDINEQLKYEFDLTTKCACPGGCDGSTEPTDPNEPTDPTDPNHPTDNGEPSSTAAGVIGIVVMVLCPFALLTYFIVGAILLKFKFQKTGTEIIPQKDFWFALPFLVKDGCLFTFSPLISLVKKDKVTYDNI